MAPLPLTSDLSKIPVLKSVIPVPKFVIVAQVALLGLRWFFPYGGESAPRSFALNTVTLCVCVCGASFAKILQKSTFMSTKCYG